MAPYSLLVPCCNPCKPHSSPLRLVSNPGQLHSNPYKYKRDHSTMTYLAQFEVEPGSTHGPGNGGPFLGPVILGGFRVEVDLQRGFSRFR